MVESGRHGPQWPRSRWFQAVENSAPAATPCLALDGMRAHSEAGPDGAAAIEVDFAAVARLVGTIRLVVDELTGNGSLSGQMNDPDLAGVFHRVEHNWHKQRVTLQTFLDSTARSVTASLAGYRCLETELADAASSGLREVPGVPG
jgi:hypothetical protein